MTPFVIDRWAAWDTLPTGDGGSGKVRKCNGEEGRRDIVTERRRRESVAQGGV